MKIEVGMYVRTDLGEIVQIVNMVVNSPLKDIRYITYPGTEWTYFDDKHDGIVKSSHNIIDLIEVGDICVIEFYSPRYRKRIKRKFEVDYIIKNDIRFENGHCQLNVLNGKWSTQDKDLNPIIKKILTHEQFESMAYKVGGVDE